MENSLNIFNNKRKIILLLLLISILLIAGGYIYYNAEEEASRKLKYNELKSIAWLKVTQVSEWFADEQGDASFISRDIFLLEDIQSFLSSGNEKARLKLKNYLLSLTGQHSYSDIILYTRAGEQLIAAKDSTRSISPELKNKIREAAESNDIKFIDIYRNNETERNFIELVSPVVDENGNIIGILVFRIDAEDQLYPVINNPITTASSEIFILRQEDDSLRILSNLKYSDNSRLNIGFPIKRKELPSVQAVTGYSGIYEGIGYSGKPVLAYLSHIPETPWFMVAQVNQSEVFADIQYKAVVTIIFTVILIVVFGTGMASIYNHRQRNIYEALYNKEKELWHSKNKFELTLDSVGEGVITANLEGKVEYMNRVAEQITGWNLNEAKGRRFEEVYSVKNELTGKWENNLLDKVLKQGIVKELANHTLLVSRKGSEIPVMDTGAPIHDQNGVVTGIVLVFEDETEKRRQEKILRDSELRLRSTLDNMLEGCQIINKDWRYIYVNDAAAKHGKTTKENLLGKRIMDVYPGITETDVFQIMKRCMDEKSTELMENEFTFPDGSKGWFELSIQETGEGLFILSQDITDRKYAENALIKAKDMAEDMNRIKSNFFSNMSHEMRTPLVAILGFADMLKERLEGSSELTEMTEYIRTGGERLLETVNLILNVAQIESEKTEVNLRDINIIPVLRETAALYSLEASRKKLNYKLLTEETVSCRVDEKLFRNIFSYLINNAIKYTERGSITIQTRLKNGFVAIMVTDTGIGIPKEKQELIWQEFRQVSEGFDRRYQGAGLGLTLTKKYVELLGGKIFMESILGEGTTFIVEFPVVDTTKYNFPEHKSLEH